MSDVHGVGGYVTAGSLFALGMASWRVAAGLERRQHMTAQLNRDVEFAVDGATP